MQRLKVWLSWWIILSGFWLLLAGVGSVAELIAGAVAASLAALLGVAIDVQSFIRFLPEQRWLRYSGQLSVNIFRDSWMAVRFLWQHLTSGAESQSSLRSVAFPSRDDGERTSAGRALALTATSLAPNSYAVGLDEEKEQLLIHELIPTEGQPGWPL